MGAFYWASIGWTTLFTGDNIRTGVMGSLHRDDNKGIFIHADDIKIEERADVIKLY